MPYYNTCYETTAGAALANTQKLEQGLKSALIQSSLTSHTLNLEKVGNVEPVFVLGTEGQNDVPAFIHPYLIPNYKGVAYLVTDMRHFRTTKDAYLSNTEFEKSVKNTTEYGLWKSRALLNLLWVSGEGDRLRTRFQFAGRIFAAWLSQTIAKTYALDLGDQTRLTALGIYYWHSLFTTDSKLEGERLEIAMIHTINTTKMSAKDVDQLFSKFGEFHTVEDYCREAREVTQNVRLRDFNAVMLFHLIKNGWYGTNARELLSAALEHPPTWVSIVYTTLTERSYKSSSLYRIIDVNSSRGNADEFRLNYGQILQAYTLAAESIDNSEIQFRPFEEDERV